MTITLMTITLMTITPMTIRDDDHADDDHAHDDDGHAGEDHGLEAEACAHMTGPDATALTAGADAASATETTHSEWSHKRVEITLGAAADGGFEGYVTYEVEEDGEYMFFSNTEATVTIEGITVESTSAVDACTEVSHLQVFDLTVGEYVLYVTSAAEVVSFVVEGGSHDGRRPLIFSGP